MSKRLLDNYVQNVFKVKSAQMKNNFITNYCQDNLFCLSASSYVKLRNMFHMSEMVQAIHKTGHGINTHGTSRRQNYK